MINLIDKMISSPDGDERILIYYFSFPHYRIAVLKELKMKLGNRLDLISGSRSRGGLRQLTGSEFPSLRIVPSVEIGPFTWDRQLVRTAFSKQYSTVIVAPAISSLSTWAILFSRRLFGRKTYLWGQCGKPGDRSAKRLLQELMNRMASGLLVYGSLEESGALEYGTSDVKIHKVKNAVPLKPLEIDSVRLFQRLQNSVGKAQTNGELRLVYVGRINDDKHVEVLLRAAEFLREDFPNLSVCLIGDGSEKARLQSEFSSSIYEFRGAIYNKEELQKEILTATFVVSPSTMGLLALDALSVGVPVLVPDHPRNGSEVEALSPGVNSFYFRHEDAQDLAVQVVAALEALATVEEKQYYSKRQSGILDWSPERVAQNICKIVGDNE